MFWVVVALLYFVLAAVAPSILGLFVNRARPDFPTLSLSLRALFVVIALICLAATSYVHVESDEIAVLNKIYGTTSLPGEHIIATNGEKGPQTTILTPGNYRLNTYLWDLSVYNAVDVAEGFVGVVKSNVIDSVHFGNLIADKPASCQQKMVSTNASGEAIAAQEAKLDEGKLTAILIPVGCIGIWEKAL